MSKSTEKKYCKVCHDAGKTEDEYRSHCTRESRDIKSKVICPTLLAQECRYCYEAGHTVKYCPSLKDREKISNSREKFARREEATSRYIESSISAVASSKQMKIVNTFACLDADSDEEAQKKSVVKEDYPVLCAPVKRAPVSKSNYAAALATTAEPVIKVVSVPTPAPWSTNRPKVAKISWAAMESDSEDDEDEDDDCEPKKSLSLVVPLDYDSDW